MKVKLITVGKLKEAYLKAAIAEYTKRLNRFAKIEIIELKDEPTPEQLSESEMEQVLWKEGKRIEAKIGERDFVTVLAIEGKELTSEAFSQTLAKATVTGHSTLTFIIGGSLGLAPEIKKRAQLNLSFGRLTLPHQLMRVVLMEQIYRAFMIQQGSPYHK